MDDFNKEQICDVRRGVRYLKNQNIDDIILPPRYHWADKNIFKDTRFKTIDTGIKHGTFSSQNFKIELTTWKRCKYGRHAELDLQWLDGRLNRRDITINAIYLDKNGKIYDFHNGVQDLKKCRKFMGDPDKRSKTIFEYKIFEFAIQYDSTTDETQLSLEIKFKWNNEYFKEEYLVNY